LESAVSNALLLDDEEVEDVEDVESAERSEELARLEIDDIEVDLSQTNFSERHGCTRRGSKLLKLTSRANILTTRAGKQRILDPFSGFDFSPVPKLYKAIELWTVSHFSAVY
jgi:hypothetical protein